MTLCSEIRKIKLVQDNRLAKQYDKKYQNTKWGRHVSRKSNVQMEEVALLNYSVLASSFDTFYSQRMLRFIIICTSRISILHFFWPPITLHEKNMSILYHEKAVGVLCFFSGWQLSNYICKSFVNVRMKSVSLLSLKYHIASILCWATLHRVLAVLKRKCTHYTYGSTLRNLLYTVSLKLCT